MINQKSDGPPEINKCMCIWFLFLTELNWNPEAINPLEIFSESARPEVIDFLYESKYIGQNKEFYLRESDKYMNYLSKGGKPFKVFDS